MVLGRSAVPPVTVLMASFGTGESAIGSLNAAVIVNVLPDFPELAGAYVRAAVGAVLSTSTLLVSGAVKLRLLAVFPNASWIVLPFKLIAEATAMPAGALSPLTMVLRNSNALVPEPDT